MYTIEQLTQRVKEISNAYTTTGTKAWDVDAALRDLQFQVGCLSKRIMQLKGERFDEGLNTETLRDKVADELSDILFVTLFIASEFNVDLEKEFDAMEVRDRDKIKERTK